MEKTFVLVRPSPRSAGGSEVLGFLVEPDLSAVQAPGAMPTDASLLELDSVTTASGATVIAHEGSLLEVPRFDFAAWTEHQAHIDELVLAMSPAQRAALGFADYVPEASRRARREADAHEAKARAHADGGRGAK